MLLLLLLLLLLLQLLLLRVLHRSSCLRARNAPPTLAMITQNIALALGGRGGDYTCVRAMPPNIVETLNPKP